MGAHDSYTGGGYTIPLNGSAKQLLSLIKRLENESWIDTNTRAIFIEFSSYAAQVQDFLHVCDI